MSARERAVEAAARVLDPDAFLPSRNPTAESIRSAWQVHALQKAGRILAAAEAAMAEEGWVIMQAGKIDEAAVWPAACKHPNSCARHRQCMYLGCEHQGFDIGAQIDAAVATLGKGAEK